MAAATFTVSVEVSNSNTGLSQTVEALVGGGSAIAVMPASLLHRLGIEPEETMHFRTQDGGRTEFPVGHAWFSVQGAEGEAMVVFGPEDRCELGANTPFRPVTGTRLGDAFPVPGDGLGVAPGHIPRGRRLSQRMTPMKSPTRPISERADANYRAHDAEV